MRMRRNSKIFARRQGLKASDVHGDVFHEESATDCGELAADVVLWGVTATAHLASKRSRSAAVLRSSADGVRFVVPIRTVHSGANSRYFGQERGVTFYNLASDQFAGHPARPAPDHPARARSRHCSSRYSSTATWRETASIDSPRSSRSTTSRLRAALHRWIGLETAISVVAAGIVWFELGSFIGLHIWVIRCPTSSTADQCQSQIGPVERPWLLIGGI